MIFAGAALHPADVAGHYDELDPFYREIWGEHVHHGLFRTGRESVAEATRALSDLVGDRLGLRAGETAVDIGCGYGGTARHFAAARGASVTGVTLSARQAEAAQTYAGRGAPGVTIAVADWLANAFPDAAFDAAYAIESSEHMADKARFFSEAARVLRPGGRLAVAAWLTRDRPGRWKRATCSSRSAARGACPRWGAKASIARSAKARGCGWRGSTI